MVALSIVATILIVLVLGALLTNDIPRAYRQRRCMGRQWRARFGDGAAHTEAAEDLKASAKSVLLYREAPQGLLEPYTYGDAWLIAMPQG